MYTIVRDDNGEYWVIPFEKYIEWWDWHDNVYFSDDGIWDEKYPEYAQFVTDLAVFRFDEFTILDINDLPDEIVYGVSD